MLTAADRTDLPQPVRLRAVDADDLAILSAMAQDAIVPVRDIGFVEAEKRFAMVVNRFMWEASSSILPTLGAERQAASEPDNDADGISAEDECYYRVLTGIRFEEVKAVQTRNIDLSHRVEMLELLAFELTDETGLVIYFAGDAAIRLSFAALHCHFEDLGEPWPTKCRPVHDIDGSMRSPACEDELQKAARLTGIDPVN